MPRAGWVRTCEERVEAGQLTLPALLLQHVSGEADDGQAQAAPLLALPGAPHAHAVRP